MLVIVVGAICVVRGWNIYCFDMLEGEGGKGLKHGDTVEGVLLERVTCVLLLFHLLLQLTTSRAVERMGG